jgi:hypothetical protein
MAGPPRTGAFENGKCRNILTDDHIKTKKEIPMTITGQRTALKTARYRSEPDSKKSMINRYIKNPNQWGKEKSSSPRAAMPLPMTPKTAKRKHVA